MIRSISSSSAPSIHHAMGIAQPSEIFWGTIHRTRLMIDRHGGFSSLLVFTLSESADPAMLTDVLRRQVRLTDTIGWLDKTRLGVILPATTESGAFRVAEKVRENWPARHERPGYHIYAYPFDGADAVSAAWMDTPSAISEETVTVSDLQVLLAQPLPLWKRCLDIVGAIAGLVLLSPVLAATVAAIRLTSRGPVIFKQQRAGLGGQPFTMFKFRSMVVDAEERKATLAKQNEQDGPAFKMNRDPRVTAVGRFIRASSIDELPQLINVLKGEMTLVGPRPLPVDESRECQGWHRNRLDVTPGLTCTWQVEGKNRVTFAEWNRMDVRYLRSRTLAHDLKLIVRTVLVVLQGRN